MCKFERSERLIVSFPKMKSALVAQFCTVKDVAKYPNSGAGNKTVRVCGECARCIIYRAVHFRLAIKIDPKWILRIDVRKEIRRVLLLRVPTGRPNLAFRAYLRVFRDIS